MHGEMNGYDDDLLKNIYQECKIPITVSGGFNNFDNVKMIFKKYNTGVVPVVTCQLRMFLRAVYHDLFFAR